MPVFQSQEAGGFMVGAETKEAIMSVLMRTHALDSSLNGNVWIEDRKGRVKVRYSGFNGCKFKNIDLYIVTRWSFAYQKGHQLS